MTRAFARWLPCEPTVELVADVVNRLDLLASGELDLTWAFPMARVEWAYPGHRPWPDSPWSDAGLSNLRLVARIPRADCELIAIAPSSPVKSLAEIAQNKRVRVCLRSDQLYEWESAIFQQYGYSLADIERGGGRYWHIAVNAHEIEKDVAEQSVDIVIGHAAYTAPWRVVAAAGFRFTPLDLEVVEALERVGFTRHTVQPGSQPGIDEPLLTLELAGQPIVSRVEVDDERHLRDREKHRPAQKGLHAGVSHWRAISLVWPWLASVIAPSATTDRRATSSNVARVGLRFRMLME
jgi:hypothetical protein